MKKKSVNGNGIRGTLPVFFLPCWLVNPQQNKMICSVIASIACYARIHGYDFHVINDGEYRQQCPQWDVSYSQMDFYSKFTSIDPKFVSCLSLCFS